MSALLVQIERGILAVSDLYHTPTVDKTNDKVVRRLFRFPNTVFLVPASSLGSLFKQISLILLN